MCVCVLAENGPAVSAGVFQRPTQKISHEERVAAVRSRAQVVKGVLTEGEIAALDEMYRGIKAEALAEADASGSEQLSHPALIGLRDSAHHTAFLHVPSPLNKLTPRCLRRWSNRYHRGATLAIYAI